MAGPFGSGQFCYLYGAGVPVYTPLKRVSTRFTPLNVFDVLRQATARNTPNEDQLETHDPQRAREAAC